MNKKNFKALVAIIIGCSVFISLVVIVSSCRLKVAILNGTSDETSSEYLGQMMETAEIVSESTEAVVEETMSENSETAVEETTDAKKDNEEVFRDANENVDISKKDYIVYTSDAGTTTLEAGNIQLWQKGEVVCTAKIPEPSQKVSNFANWPVYIDKKGNLICLHTYKKDDEYVVEYTILMEEIEEIFTSVPKTFIKDKSGKYGILYVVEEEEEEEWYDKHIDFEFEPLDDKQLKKVKADIIWLNEETIEEISFAPYIVAEPDLITLYYWSLAIVLKGDYVPYYVDVYIPSFPIEVDRDFLNEMEKTFDISEYDEKYAEIVRETKRLEAEQKNN